MLKEFVDNYNNTSYPKNYPFKLDYDVLNGSFSYSDRSTKYLSIRLNVLVAIPCGESFILKKVFCIEDIIPTTIDDYIMKLESSIIDKFNSIKFKDTILSLIK